MQTDGRKTPPPTTRWIFILLLAVAATIRFISLDLVSITADEGIHGIFANNIALFNAWPLVGLPSVGIRNSAFFLYLLAPVYFFFRHPLAGVAWINFLNLIGLYLFIQMAQRRWGTMAAFFSSLLWIFSPWAVMYARTMWPPSCLPVLSLALIWISFQWLETAKPRLLFWMILFGVLMPQMHFSGFCGTVWLAVIIWLGRKQIQWKPVLWGIAVGLLTLSPWIHYQHSINHWQDLHQAITAAKGKHGLGETFINILKYYQALLGSGEFQYWFVKTPSQLPEYFPSWITPAQILLQVALVLWFLAAMVWSVWQPKVEWRMLAVWCVLPVGMLLLIRPDIHPHYVGVAFPIPFLLMGLALQEGLRRMPAFQFPFQVATACGLLAICAFHLVFLHGWYRFVDDGRPDGRGHFQLSYRHRAKVANSILDECPKRLISLEGSFNFSRHPAYEFPYSYFQMTRGFTKYSPDPLMRFWVDEGEGPEEHPGWVTEHEWYVGPTRIRRQRAVGM